MILVAHGIGGVRDLPVPLSAFYWGAAAVLVVSFVALGALWREAQLGPRAGGRPLGEGLERLLRSRWLRVPLQALSGAALALVFATALVGTTDPNLNLAPTVVYVLFWVGLVPVQVVLGDVYRALNPWRAWADLAVWMLRRVGAAGEPLARYPERLGRWPAAVLLFLFTALELAAPDPAAPRGLALAIALYSYVTWFGMAAYGRELWLDRGDGFAVYYGLLARIAPFASHEGRIVVRWPLTALARPERVPGTGAVVAVMLGSVAFDGISRTSHWQDLVARVQRPFILDRPLLADLAVSGVAFAALLGCIVVMAVAFLAALGLAGRIVRAPRSLLPDFLPSLIPIALVYAVAHYFTLLLVQGQFAWPLANDPFGKGWDLFGGAAYQPNLTPITPNTVWYIQVGALVAGHVAGLVVAHDRAVALFRDRDAALRSQYAVLALMVLYTVGGLWLLSTG